MHQIPISIRKKK